ncbi:hypothetical protein SALBM311S_09831 [Streptomyces alboniger]
MDLRAARADAASRLGGGEMYLHDLLDSSAAQCPDASAVRDHQGVWTYAELARHSHAVSNWLIGRGVVAGDRLLVRAIRAHASRPHCCSVLPGAVCSSFPSTRR